MSSIFPSPDERSGPFPVPASGKATGTRPGTCPVCSARFRGLGSCSRCGADLLPLMAVIVRARRLRLRAREALLCGSTAAAAHLAREAQATCATARGAAILELAEWIVTGGRGEDGSSA